VSSGPILSTVRKQRVNDQISSWASGKADLAKMQEQSLGDLNALKMKLMKEESEARMTREDRLSRLREQEEQLRIDILYNIPFFYFTSNHKLLPTYNYLIKIF